MLKFVAGELNDAILNNKESDDDSSNHHDDAESTVNHKAMCT